MRRRHEVDTSGRTGTRHSLRFGMTLFLGAVFAASTSLVPGRASDVEELCRLKLAFYVKTIDLFLEEDARPQPRYSLEPYIELNKGIAPLEGCTIEEVKAEISKSRFARPAYNPNRDVWVFILSNERIDVGFSYIADQKKSELHHAGWTRKFL